MNRRNLLKIAGFLSLFRTGSATASYVDSHKPVQPDLPIHDMSAIPKSWMGNEKIAMLMYPGFTALDFTGPQYMFGNLMGASIFHVAKTREAVLSDTKLALLPNTVFADVPDDLDLLFIPGAGSAVFDVINDPETMEFIKSAASKANLISSVCTGSIILGSAGLLKGRRVTSHWMSREELSVFGAIPVNERVVWDGNIVTGAGVSAGLDLGLEILGKWRGDFYAQSIQLLAEYHPNPPYNSGTLDVAPADVKSLMQGMFKGYKAKIKSIGF